MTGRKSNDAGIGILRTVSLLSSGVTIVTDFCFGRGVVVADFWLVLSVCSSLTATLTSLTTSLDTVETTVDTEDTRSVRSAKKPTMVVYYFLKLILFDKWALDGWMALQSSFWFGGSWCIQKREREGDVVSIEASGVMRS